MGTTNLDTLVVGALTAPAATLTVATVATLSARDAFATVTGNGAIVPSATDKTYIITKGTAAALTLADPTATTHDGVVLTFISATAAAHTLSNAAGSGFNGGGAASDVGTFGGAIGDGISVVAYQGKWLVLNNTNVTLA